MKFRAIISASVMVLCLSCTDRTPAPEGSSLMDASRQELASALAERDRLLSLVKDMSADMEQIRALENIVAVSGCAGEDAAQDKRLRADVAALKNTLARRRRRLAELEESLRESGQLSDELSATVEAFRRQIAYQASDLERMQARLDSANFRIEILSGAVDSLSESMANVSGEYDAFRTASADRETELNMCYYVVATKSELRRHHIIEGGFLRRTKLLEGDFDRDFFTVGDRRTLSSVNLGPTARVRLHSKHPAGSYEFSDSRLVITDAGRFWELTNYLVIEVD